METTFKEKLILKEEDVYFQKFLSKDGQEFGLRFATPKDAKNISKMFKEIYNYEYINPIVYDDTLLKKEISDPNKFWVVGELIENKIKEIAGVALVEKERYIAHAGSMITRKKFQGLGVTTKIAVGGLITITKMPQFKDVLRLDSEVRGPQIKIQAVAQNAGAVPYSIIPAYINFGDKREFEVDDNCPCPPQHEETAIIFSMIFRNLWKKRDKNVVLLDNEVLVFFYKYMKSKCKRMKDDILYFEKGKNNKGYELYGVSKDYYNAIVKLYGYIKEKSINNLLKVYKNWRIILWKIPTTHNGVQSMKLALEKGFKVLGYDIGFNNINWTLFDSIILAYYPLGHHNLLDVNCLDSIKPLYNRIKEQFKS